MKKWIDLLFKYNERVSFSSILIIFELIIALSVFNICYGMAETGQIKKQSINELSNKNLVIYDRNNIEGTKYCESNGIILGSVYTGYIDYGENYNYENGYSIDTYSKDFLNELSMPLQKGNWLNDIDYNSVDFAVVVPPSLEVKYRFGQTYNLTVTYFDFSAGGTAVRYDKKINIYVCGVLKHDVFFNANKNTFDDAYHSIIGLDVSGILKTIAPATSYSYCKLNNEVDINDLKGLDIRDFKSDREQLIEEINGAIGFPLIMCCILIIIFIAGFIGMHFLNISKKEKQYAIFSVVGISKAKALTIQAIKDIGFLILPFILSLIVLWATNLFVLPIHISMSGVLLSFAFVLATYIAVSIFTLIRLIKYNPITSIQKNVT